MIGPAERRAPAVRARAASRAARRRFRDAALLHPRHVVLAVAAAGLLLGGRVPASAVAVTAVVLAAVGVVVPLVRSAFGGVALGAVLVVAAIGAAERTAALDRTALSSSFGRGVTGEVVVLAAPRGDRFGGRRALARFRGEPVLVRLPRWLDRVHVDAGTILRVHGTLKPPDLGATAVRAHATLRASAATPAGERRGLAGAVDDVRRRAQATLAHGLPPAEAGLLRGMVLGDDAALPDDLREAFRAAGLSHLTAASGANVMLLAALALALATVAGIGIRARSVLALGLIALYIPLAGGGPSIQRAGIMGAAMVAAVVAGRPASRWYAILLAAVVTLARDPRAAADPGWQLSFAAVLGILALAPATRDRLRARGVPRAAAEAIAVTVAATLATAPIIALRFDRTSLVSLPANVLAAPAVAPVMWLGMSAAAVGQLSATPAAPLVALASLPVAYIAWIGRTLGSWPGAEAAVAPWIVVAAALLASVALRVRGVRRWSGGERAPGVRRRRLAVAAALVLLVLAALGHVGARRGGAAPPPPNTLRVTALDVGQGDATLLQAGGRAILVDTGPEGGPVTKELAEAGVTRLDLLVVTHPAADHLGAAPEVLRRMPVATLLDGRDGDRTPASRALDAPLERGRTRVVRARAGDVLTVGPIVLHVLWPPPTAPMPGADPNDRAIVAEATAFDRRVLLTADAESPVLAPLDLDEVDVLKVSHHGSDDPGLPALLTRLRPRVALLEVGRHNTYGHPAPSTLRALGAVPSVLRTDRDGSVRVDLAAA